MTKKPDTISVFIGSGGSGINTLIALNRMLIQDGYWSAYLSRYVHYIILDSNKDDITKFEDEIDKYKSLANRAQFHTIPISQGINEIEGIINEKLGDNDAITKDKDVRETLKNHWFHNQDGIPYDAPKDRFKDLDTGASQCPPIGYFLAWARMPELLTELEKIRETIQNSDRQATIRFYIVAGLAGGTGRGTWQLISFAIRQVFTKDNNPPLVTAYLFDASHFGVYGKENDDHWIRMQVNALTGVSEASAWLKSDDVIKPKRFYFSLPSMDAPGDRQSDLIKTEDELTRPAGLVYLLFREGRAHTLEETKPPQVFEIAGNALYAQATQNAIRTEKSNEKKEFGSIASSILQVQGPEIRDYFERELRVRAVDGLFNTCEEEAKKAAKEFLTRCGLFTSVTTDHFNNYRPSEESDENASLLQLTLKHLNEELSQPLKDFKQALTDQEGTVATQKLNILLKSNDRVKIALEKACRELIIDCKDVEKPVSDTKSFQEEAQKAALKLVTDTDSLRAVESFYSQISKTSDSDMYNLLNAKTTLSPDDDEGGGNKKLKEINDKFNTSKGWNFNGISMKPITTFTQNEIDELNMIDQDIKLVYFDAVVAALKAQTKGFVQILEKAPINIGISKFLDNIKNDDDFKTSTNNIKSMIIGDDDLEKIRDSLFVTNSTLEKGLCDAQQLTYTYKRIIKPYLSEDWEKLLKEGEDSNLGQEVQKLIEHLSDDDLPKPRSSYILVLSKLVNTGVHFKSDFVEKNYNIVKTLSDLRVKWDDHFNLIKQNKTHFSKIVSEFYSFFGCEPKDTGANVLALPDQHEFVFSVMARMAYDTQPYWVLSGSSIDSKVTLFISGLDNEKANESVQKKIKQHYKMGNPPTVTIIETGKDKSGSNPFLILAYSDEYVAEPYEIRNLDYYTIAPVKDVLLKCESPYGDSLFNPGPHVNQVTGLSSPIFIREQFLQDSRWHPWSDKNIAMDALIHAILPHTTDDNTTMPNKDNGKLDGGNINPDGNKANADSNKLNIFKNPLLKFEDGKWIFTRKTAKYNIENKSFVEDGYAQDGKKSQIDKGVGLGKNLEECLNFLAGEVGNTEIRSQGIRWAQQIKNEATQLKFCNITTMREPVNFKEAIETMKTDFKRPEYDQDRTILDKLIKHLD